MELEMFLNSLDKQHSHHKELSEGLRYMAEEHTLLVEKKDSNLVKIVRAFLDEKRLFPLVDKRLGVVFGVEYSTHLMLRIDLYRYHIRMGNKPSEYVNPRAAADQWLLEGMGYYFASTPTVAEALLNYPPRRIIAAEGYRPDRFDESLFKAYEVEYTL